MGRGERARRGHDVPFVGASASAVMQRDVVCVREDVPASMAASLMVYSGLSRAPVVDADGRLLGVVSRQDLLRARGPSKRGRGARPGDARLAGRFPDESHPRRTTGDRMTPSCSTIYESMPVVGATNLMTRSGDDPLVVLAPGDVVIGLVSALDVARWLAGLGAPPAPRLPTAHLSTQRDVTDAAPEHAPRYPTRPR